jgi:hypothetical protein
MGEALSVSVALILGALLGLCAGLLAAAAFRSARASLKTGVNVSLLWEVLAGVGVWAFLVATDVTSVTLVEGRNTLPRDLCLLTMYVVMMASASGSFLKLIEYYAKNDADVAFRP